MVSRKDIFPKENPVLSRICFHPFSYFALSVHLLIGSTKSLFDEAFAEIQFPFS